MFFEKLSEQFSEFKRQLILALGAILVVMAITAGIVLSVDEPFLGTWGALFFISCVPAQVLLGVWRNTEFPNSLMTVRQPTKGIINLVITFTIGLFVTIVSFYTVGGGAFFPRPPLIHYSIVTVVITFWFVIVWQCWPVKSTDKNPFFLAIVMFLIIYGMGYFVFMSLFSFEFMSKLPVYVAEIDPGGLFDAWYAVSFLVTTVAVIFTMVLLDFWPTTIWVKSDNKFLWGLVNTIIILGVSGGIYSIAIINFDADPVKYLIHGPVSFIFGVFIPLNLLEGKLFHVNKQPVKGVMLIFVSVLSGFILNKIYFGFPQILPTKMTSGFPSYELELWVANAMLAFSFPILVAFTDHFNFWPLRVSKDDGTEKN